MGVPNAPRSVLGLIAVLVDVARLTVVVPIGYLSVLTGAAWYATLVHRRSSTAGVAQHRFAILVPAHDEEPVIGATLQALSVIDYPRCLYTVHVVADHCTDRTVELARAAGVDVREHTGPERGKGAALRWGLRSIGRDVAPDAIAIIDADTIVDPSFLRATNTCLSHGALAVQGQYRVLDPGSSPAGGLRAAALALRHHLRPLGRTALGASSGLYGNGMVFASTLLAAHEWSDHLTEDLEFQLELLLDGVTVAYAPEAIVEAVMPPTLAAARTQNERWERGRLLIARRFIGPLARAALARRGRQRVAAADALADQLVPPLSVLAAAVVGVGLAGSTVSARRGRGVQGHWLAGALTVHVVSGLVLARMPRTVYFSLLRAPEMILWKVRMWLRMLVRPGDVAWLRTTRAQGAT